MKQKNLNKTINLKRLGIHRCLVLSAADCEALQSFASLQQVGAWLMTLAAYAYGSSLDFAVAIAKCNDEAKEKALHDCINIWQLKKTIRSQRKNEKEED